ncbi:MAG: lyase family protein, partial [Pseudomonadota bacterium]
MTATPFDSAVLRGHLSDADAAALFTDAAEIRAMMLVEAALAEAQGALGLIPAEAAEAIGRAAREAVIDPAELAEGTAAAGVVVPAFVERFRRAVADPAQAAWLHHGATSQDILDTALVLRLKRLLEQLEARQRATLGALAAAARRWRDLPMAARTRGQAATPTSFGARIALWGAPLLRSLDRQAQLAPRLLVVSLHGAAGTSAALGEAAPALRARMAARLGLGDAPLPWHAARDGLAELASHLAILTAAHGKMGRDLLELARSEAGEARAGAAGGSSTMPHKRNPVGPEALIALARHASRLSGALQEAMLAEHERDGAAWTLEWLSLPQLCLTAAASAR